MKRAFRANSTISRFRLKFLNFWINKEIHLANFVPSRRKTENYSEKPENSTGCYSPDSKYKIKKTFRMKHICLPKLSDCRGCLRYKEDAVPL